MQTNNRKLVLVALLGAVMLPTGVNAGVLISGDEALKLAFAGCDMVRKTQFISAANKAEVEKLAGVPLEDNIVYPYEAMCQGKLGGVAYIDVQRVRTQPQRLLVAVNRDGKVMRVEMLSFDEPMNYLPKGSWYGQFLDKGLGDALSLQGSVRPITGATLTARAASAAVRRVLALHQVLYPSTAVAQ